MPGDCGRRGRSGVSSRPRRLGPRRVKLLASEGSVSRLAPPLASRFRWPRRPSDLEEGRCPWRSDPEGPWLTFKGRRAHLGTPAAATCSQRWAPRIGSSPKGCFPLPLLPFGALSTFVPSLPTPTPHTLVPWLKRRSPVACRHPCSPVLSSPCSGAAHCVIRPNICPSNHWRIHQCQWAAHCSDSLSRTTRAVRSAHCDHTALPGGALKQTPPSWHRLDSCFC